MKKIRLASLCFVICVGLMFPPESNSDIVLEYLVKDAGVSETTTRLVIVKDGEIMVKAAGGGRNLDFLYRHAPESVVIVDHHKRTLMTVDEQQVARINQQAQYVLPLLQLLGEQIAGLSPDQRLKWQKLLGDGIPLDMLARSADPAEPTRLVPAGGREAAGIHCRTMQVIQGETPIAEVCLADAAAMKIPEKDYATIRALFDFSDRLAAGSRGLARGLGLAVPDITAGEVPGIPVEFVGLSGTDNRSMTLHRIDTSAVSPELMQIPGDYRTVPLTLRP